MAQLSGIYSIKFTVNVTIVGVTETVILTLPGVDVRSGSSIIRLIGWAQMTPGIDATSIALAFRRTALTGALVGEANAETFGAAATQVRGQTVMTEDQPGDVASQPYVLTALQAGGVADGNALQGYIIALVG